jgi:hypothetical protein
MTRKENEGEMKIFHNKQKLKKFITTKPVLQKILKDSYTEEEIRASQEDARKNKLFSPNR